MAFSRRITSTLMIAMIVAAGVLASTHTHSHVCEDGQHEVHVGHCAHSSCGHDHSHDGHSHDSPNQPSDEDHSSSPDHDHDDCQICRLLANFQSTTLAATPTVYEALVVAQFFKAECEPTEGLVVCAVARGPPALLASDS